MATRKIDLNALSTTVIIDSVYSELNNLLCKQCALKLRNEGNLDQDNSRQEPEALSATGM